MKNKTIAQMMIGSVVLAIVTAIFESSLDYTTAENLYTLAGFGMCVFGIWGGIRLYVSKE